MFHEEKNQSPNRTTFFNQEATVFPNTHEEDSLSCLKDSVISIEYRLKTLEALINSRIDRQECLSLLERKANNSYVKKGFQEIYGRIQADRLKEQGNLQKMQQQQRQKINDLKKKLKQINNTRQSTQLGSPFGKDNSSLNFSQHMSKKLNKVLVKPQQLYLESNQTMFSMLIDELKQLKQRDTLIERLIESKHKKTISLNNQVCRKLQHMEGELQQTIRFIEKTLNPKTINAFQPSISAKKPNKKCQSKTQKQQIVQRYDKTFPQNQAFQSIRLELLSKSIQTIQMQLSQKLNIKDVIPLIKQNVPTFEEALNQIKSYVQQNFESMRKILQNQSEINQEISKSNKVAWWHCYEKLQLQQSERSQILTSFGYILFSKEIMNIIPENVSVQKDEEYTVKILTKGWYLIHAYGLSIEKSSAELRTNPETIESWIEVNSGTKHPLQDKILINLAAQSQLRIITLREDLFVQIQKL